MSDCLFCGSFVGEENGDGGCKGRAIGNRDVCEQCLAELKYWLQGTLARSPSMREKPIEKEEVNHGNENLDEENPGDEEEVSEESIGEGDDPLSAKPIE
jgi:hypothetical protein